MKKDPAIFFGRNILREALSVQAPVSKIFYETSAAKTFASSLSAVKRRNIILEAGIPNEVKHQSHQGIAFFTTHEFYLPFSDVTLLKYPFVVLCNQIEDVHNFGSIARCSGAFGAKLIIHESKGSASLTAAAMKASAGVAFHLKFMKVESLHEPLKALSSAGFSIIGMDASDKSVSLFDWVPTFPLALVLGSESDGIAPTLKARCQTLIKIPMEKFAESLNVSHAAAIAMNWIYKSESKIRAPLHR